MKITLAMILKYMKTECGMTPAYFCCGGSEGIAQAQIWSRDVSSNPHTVYINDHFEKQMSDSCEHFIICSDNAVSFETSFVKTCAIFPSINKVELLECVENAIFYYNEFQDRLLQLILSENDTEDILEYCHQYLKNPLILHTLSNKRIAATRTDIIDHPTWSEPVYSGFPAASNPSEAEWLQSYESLIPLDGKAKIIASSVVPNPFLSCAVLLDGKAAAILNMAEKNTMIEEGDIDFVENICRLLSFELQKYKFNRVNRGIAYEEMVRDLLEGTLNNETQIQNRAMMLGWKLGNVHKIVKIIFQQYFPGEARLQAVLDDLIDLHLPGKGICYKDAIIFVLSSSAKDIRICIRYLNDYCQKNHLRCGWSTDYKSLSDTSLYFYQADRALMLSSEACCQYEDLAYSDILCTLRQEKYIDKMLHPSIRILKEYDQQNKTELYDSLKVFCECAENQSHAAEMLHIHRTTMVYRLHRIEELTSIDFQNMQVMNHIFLSFQLEEYAFAST